MSNVYVGPSIHFKIILRWNKVEVLLIKSVQRCTWAYLNVSIELQVEALVFTAKDKIYANSLRIFFLLGFGASYHSRKTLYHVVYYILHVLHYCNTISNTNKLHTRKRNLKCLEIHTYARRYLLGIWFWSIIFLLQLIKYAYWNLFSSYSVL